MWLLPQGSFSALTKVVCNELQRMRNLMHYIILLLCWSSSLRKHIFAVRIETEWKKKKKYWTEIHLRAMKYSNFFASFIQFFRLANWMAMNVGVLRWNGIIWVGFMRREPPLHVQVGSQPLQEHNVIALKSFSFFEIRFSNDLYFLSHSYSSIFKSVARGCSFIVNACTFCDDVKMHLDNESNSSLCAKSENLSSHSFCLFCNISYSS